MRESQRRTLQFIYRPQNLLVLTFLGLILLGTIALSLPASANVPISPVDALFTSTSAVCVTGLITKDTASDFTRTGQTVILILIQLGGLGVMTFAAITAAILGRRVSFGSQAALSDVFFQDARGGLNRQLSAIIGLTLGLELLGAVTLWAVMPAPYGAHRSPFDAAFLSISAFCNAGFSVYADSVISLNGSPIALSVIALLIILGGLGYTVLLEAVGRALRPFRRTPNATVRWSLNSRVVVSYSAGLIVLGAMALAAFGLTDRPNAAPVERIGHALFQSISARTAGFNSVDIPTLPLPALMMFIPLMFIGGSPGSAAGGIKTTSIAVWIAQLIGRLRGSEDISLFERRIPLEIVRKARLLVSVAILWNAVGVLVLVVTERANEFSFQGLIFEQVSAFATVGLSTGITPELTTGGKLWIIASMFVGRLGPLTVALAVFPRPRRHITYPYERIMIG